ncbi:MAG: pirin family protein [Rhodospirillales bacterium]
MSWQPAETPNADPAGACPTVETVIVPRARDIGGFDVRRVLPSAQRRLVGPFIFFDQMGPVTFAPGKGIEVRPHPHIGLATVTYLFDGTIVHRDSLGSLQPIVPGDVNWMTAGRGIAHSERADPDRRAAGHSMSGLQIWVALPQRHEEAEPAFVHHAGTTLPALEGDGKSARVVAGSLFGKTSPVQTFSDMFYADVSLAAGATLPVEAPHEERAAYLIEGAVEADGTVFEPGRLLVFAPGSKPVLTARGAARLVLLGGEPMDGPRHIWWNFVSSRSERIEQAKADWKAGRFAAVPGETEFIPLPEG